ncbi:E3 ubiquitin ligase TRIM40-like [Crassostrea angulata]|uniref:E3 ubiquitin ligase TRIM40-like n=1 Tax=Magallana angulata TaxID=2784310 RepID=UPI0022B0CA6C|nr:E3 ubiquitin ligase TRIM40-like [Crassostrea angulata]
MEDKQNAARFEKVDSGIPSKIHRTSAQDVIRCDLCETPVPPLYCDICHISLCKACTGEHILKESKLHIVVPIKHQKSSPIFPKCPEHTAKLCELHCNRCDIPICVQCITSKKHAAHDVIDILNFIEKKNKALQADLEELGKIIYPKYQEIASSFLIQKDDVDRNTEKLISAINKQGAEWHREIDTIMRKMKSGIENTVSENLVVLEKQEVEIKHSLSEITLNINELKKLLDSNDAKLLSKYKSRNAEFRRLPPKLVISLPNFSPQRIDTDKLFQQFGFLTALSITTEERLYPLISPEIDISCQKCEKWEEEQEPDPLDENIDYENYEEY